MEICLTWDYEIYFGENTGTVEACMLEPTARLLDLAKRHNASMTFFIDISFLKALKNYSPRYPYLQYAYENICTQLKKMVEEGHRCELHIHSHWEDSFFNGSKWVLDVKRYRIQDFPEAMIFTQVKEGCELLKSITGQSPRIFRAGGYCVQPFDTLRKALMEQGIQVDSSVFAGGKSPEGTSQFFDFSTVHMQEEYSFYSDPCLPSDGEFTEIPISSNKFSPLFFWKLYILGRLNPKEHKGFGDGQALSAKGFKKQQLKEGGIFPVSADGYYASDLKRYCKKAEKEGRSRVVVIGHPKAQTLYSMKALEALMKERYIFSSL